MGTEQGRGTLDKRTPEPEKTGVCCGKRTPEMKGRAGHYTSVCQRQGQADTERMNAGDGTRSGGR